MNVGLAQARPEHDAGLAPGLAAGAGEGIDLDCYGGVRGAVAEVEVVEVVRSSLCDVEKCRLVCCAKTKL